MRTLLIDNYDSYTYNLYQIIAEVNGGKAITNTALDDVAAGPHAWRACCGVTTSPELLLAEPPLVFYNDEITLEQIMSMVHAGTVHSIVISPGPGTPLNVHDVGK